MTSLLSRQKATNKRGQQAAGLAILAIAAVFVAVAVLTAGISVSASQPGKDMRIQAENAEATAGDDVYVMISFETNPGVYGFDILVSYDPSYLLFEDSSLAPGFQNDGYVSEVSSDTLRIYYENEDIADNGTSGNIATLHFAAMEQSVSQIRLSIGPGGACSVNPLGDVSASFINGEVTITEQGSEGGGGSGSGGSDKGGDSGSGPVPGDAIDNNNGGGNQSDIGIEIAVIIIIVVALILVIIAAVFMKKRSNI